jgi:DNA modification methylase
VQGATGQRADRTFTAQAVYRDTCRKCGAVRVDHQLGLEATPEKYVARMVEVFREVRRVLRDDGTLWLNLGDSYVSTAGSLRTIEVGGKNYDALNASGGDGMKSNSERQRFGKAERGILKSKDLVGIPWRVAFALQADGWYLRSDIIWSKPNPMPESVTDRPSKSHEYVFLFSKSQRYFYDADAVAEDSIHAGRVVLASGGEAKNAQKGKHGRTSEGFTEHDTTVKPTRNARTVWEITIQPYAGAHYATMPPELASRCIKAGSKPTDTVLDPFGGSGTTASVATGLGRNAIHIDLNPDLSLAIERIGPLLVDVKT